MSDTIKDKKFVELSYKITDQKTGDVLVAVEYPLGYVHGANDILAPDILDELKGKTKGDVVEVPIDCNQLYGARDEGLVFTDYIENVPKEYHEIGTTIVMETENGTTRNFIVTQINDKSLTIDGNNPLCGREVTFTLKVLNVRDATDEEINKACEFAAASDFIKDLPKSYDTLIGENGIRLSGGQKQRLSIARAVLKNSPIILLDEATSSLDAESEEKVQNAILNLTKNKTTLVIAHRLSTIIRADKIIVLNKGQVTDFGTHTELLKNSMIYKNLYSKQLSA